MNDYDNISVYIHYVNNFCGDYVIHKIRQGETTK